jgi:RHS repeat-associated protein
MPEKGVYGNGAVYYYDYDAVGRAGRTVDGPNDMRFRFDRAGRLLTVRDQTSNTVLKSYTYAGADEGDWSNGKLRSAVSYNIGYDSLQSFLFCDDFETGDTSTWTSTASKAFTDLQTEVRQTYTYSGRGGLISEVETEVNGHRFTQGMTWNDLGQLAAQSYPDLDGYAGDPSRTITNQYSGGTLTGVAPGYATSISYHANGMINQVMHGNGVVDSHDLDPNWMRRQRAIHSTAGSWCQSGCYYQYDGAGNIVKIGGGHYLYDKVSRLTEGLVRTDHTQSYSYDAFGNITSITTNGEKSYINVSWSSNRLSAPVTYDAAGNLVSRGGITYEWYPTGELSSRTGPGLNRRFLYDAGGERLASENLLNGVQTYTIRGLDGKVLRTYELEDGVWTWTKDYIYRAGQLLASETPAGTNHFTLDHLGSIRVVTDGSGAYLKYHVYYPFGEEAGTEWEDEAMKFTGHERDLEGTTDTDDDLDYMHARYYSPIVGRFLSVDPVEGKLGTSQNWNRYSYVLNNPMIYIDPNGLDVLGYQLITSGPNRVLTAPTGGEIPKEAIENLGPLQTKTAAVMRFNLEIKFEPGDDLSDYRVWRVAHIMGRSGVEETRKGRAEDPFKNQVFADGQSLFVYDHPGISGFIRKIGTGVFDTVYRAGVKNKESKKDDPKIYYYRIIMYFDNGKLIKVNIHELTEDAYEKLIPKSDQ